MMNKLIHSNDLMYIIAAHAYPLRTSTNEVDMGMFIEGIQQAISECKAIEPIEHGKWITHAEDNPFGIYGECSKCGFEQSLSKYLNYCPNCGARMDAMVMKK